MNKRTERRPGTGEAEPLQSGAPSDEAASRPPADRPPWNPSVERIAIAGFWLFLAALEVLRRTVNPFGPPSQGGIVAYVGAATYVVWALLTPLVFTLAHRLPIERGTATKRILTLALVGIAIAILIEMLNFAAIRALFDPATMAERPGSPQFQFTWSAPIMRLWFLDELVIFLAVLAAGFARSYFVRLRARERESAQFQAQAAGLEAQLSDARLSALQMQLNPHFLFNTLHAVSSMADEDPAGVQRIVARLSALLRRALESTARQEVTLEEELSFLQDYFEIQQVRFLGRLTVKESIDPGVRLALVPNLILQPIVENAVKFSADNGANGAGRIELGASRSGENLILTVRDNGPGLRDEVPAREGGVGLANTKARLAVLYGEGGSLDLQNAPEGGLIATITIPYHTQSELRSHAEE